MPLTITTITALALAALMFLQTYAVILRRREKGIVLGDGGDKTAAKRIRGHANTVEQAPIFLILVTLAELREAPLMALALICAVFVLSRVAHAYYFLDVGAHWKFRRIGMTGTALMQIAIMALLVYTLL